MIEGERIYLNKLSSEYADLLFYWRNKEYIRYNSINQKEIVYEDHINWVNNELLKDSSKRYVVLDKKKDVPIGLVSLKNINCISKNAEFEIYIGEEEYLGKGYGYEITKTMLRYAFEKLEMEKVYLTVFEKNTTAINCYKKIGFKKSDIIQDCDMSSEGSNGFIKMVIDSNGFSNICKFIV